MVGTANQLAFDWCENWPDWPGPVTTIVGPSGAGKSHLAAIWCAKSNAKSITFSEVNGGFLSTIADQSPVLCLDDADAIVGDGEAEEALFHLFNHLRANEGSLLLTAKREPSRWGLDLPDLASRLKASAMVTLMPPDDGMMAALLVKHFADRQLDVDQAVIDYLLARMDRSYASIRDLVIALDRVSLAERRRITIPLAREILAIRVTEDAGDDQA